MNIFKKIFTRKRKDELAPLKVRRLGLDERLRKSRKRNFIAKIAITYEGKSIRQFPVNVSAYSRDNAAFKINKDLDLKLISVVKDRRKKK